MLILFMTIEWFLSYLIYDIKENENALSPKSGRFFRPHFLENLKEPIFFRKDFMLILFMTIEGFLSRLIHDIKDNENAISPKNQDFFQGPFISLL